jgi:hypothetical protein
VPSWAAWPGLAAIAIPALAYGPLTRFPGLAALPPVIGTILVLEARNPLVNRVLAAAPMQWIGSLSYSWYLWHWPVLVLAKTLWPGMGAGGGLACSGLALVLSALTFRFLEAPVRHARWLIPRPAATLAGAVALTASVLAICFLWRAQVTAGVADGRQVTFLRARDEMPEIYRAGCHLDLDDSKIRDCVYGDPSSATTIVLWGDSHAAQWFPAVKAVAERRQWRLVPMTKSGCPAADIPASAIVPGLAPGGHRVDSSRGTAPRAPRECERLCRRHRRSPRPHCARRFQGGVAADPAGARRRADGDSAADSRAPGSTCRCVSRESRGARGSAIRATRSRRRR